MSRRSKDEANREVRFGHTASLQPSSGAIVAKPVASYQETEEGVGKKYRGKMRALRKLHRKKKRRETGGDTDATTSPSSSSNDSDTATSSTSEMSTSGSSAETTPVTSKKSVSRSKSPMLRHMKNLEKLAANVQAQAPLVRDLVRSIPDSGILKSITRNLPSGPSSKSSDRSDARSDGPLTSKVSSDNVEVTAKTVVTVSRPKKRGLLRRIFRSLTKPFRRKNKKKSAKAKVSQATSNLSIQTTATKGEVTTSSTGITKDETTVASVHGTPVKKPSTTRNSNEKVAKKSSKTIDHIADELTMDELSDFIHSDDGRAEMSEEEKLAILDHGLDEQRLISYINLIGLDSHLPLRDAEEIKTDQKRTEFDKKFTEPSQVKNAAVLENIDFDSLDGYDDDFMRLWDLEAGVEMLNLMATQTVEYASELTELRRDNEELSAELQKIRSDKQEAFFRIKDLEAEAVAAEELYHKLCKRRPTGHATRDVVVARKNYDIIAALLQQREDLFRELHQVRQKSVQDETETQKQEDKVEKDLADAFGAFREAKKHYIETSKRVQTQKHELQVLQQELDYLVEEVSVFSAEDGDFARLDVRSAIRKLSQRKKDSASNQNNFAKRLATLESSLANLKKIGQDSIRIVEDTHEELHWHLTRRDDILQNLIKGYMHEKRIRSIDPEVLRVLQTQQPNLAQLDEQTEIQTALKETLSNDYEETKAGNEELRKEIAAVEREMLLKKERVLRDAKRRTKELDAVPSRRFAERGDIKVHTSKHVYQVDSREETWDELSLTGSHSWSQTK